MISVDSLSRRYGNTLAVDNVSFEIGANEVVGLLGHNGAGKTTIMRMLSGYLEPSTGSVTVAGVDMAEGARQVQTTLGYLPEHLPIYPEMLVADYLDYVATLILDEPTNGLDPGQTSQMRDLLRRLARRATVILSTHIMQEVEAVCDRVLVMAAGRLVLDAPLADLRKSRTLVLRAGTEEPDLERWLRRLPQIAAVHPRADIAGGESWVLTLRENADADTAANNIAQCVVRAGASLFQLQPQLRDLDSIFRDATSGKAGT